MKLNDNLLLLRRVLAVLYYFNQFFHVIFSICQISLCTYKSMNFYNYEPVLVWDFVSSFIYLLLEPYRINLALQATRMPRIENLVYVQVLTLIAIGLHSYWLAQTYVLRIDLILNTLGLLITGGEFALCGIQTFFMISSTRY